MKCIAKTHLSLGSTSVEEGGELELSFEKYTELRELGAVESKAEAEARSTTHARLSESARKASEDADAAKATAIVEAEEAAKAARLSAEREASADPADPVPAAPPPTHRRRGR